MRVGILGSGLMGGKLGTIFARAGHEVTFSYARSEQKLKALARDAGDKARYGKPRQAAEADAVLLAVHWSRVDEVLDQAGNLPRGVVVTCSLPMNDDDSDLVIGHAASGAEELQKKIPKAQVVAAFNTVPSEVLPGVYAARRRARRPSMVCCGRPRSRQGARRRARSRRGIHARGCRSAAHRALCRTVRPPGRPARIQRSGRSRARLSVRTVGLAGWR